MRNDTIKEIREAASTVLEMLAIIEADQAKGDYTGIEADSIEASAKIILAMLKAESLNPLLNSKK